MSERKIDVDTTKSTAPTITSEERSKLKARLASVMERGLTGDRLLVPDLPPDLHGEWVPDDPHEIARMESMGFTKDDTYAKSRSLHSKGDGYSRIADVIYMTAPKHVKEMIDEVRHDQFTRIHGKPGTNRTLREEREYKSGVDLPVISESRTDSVTIVPDK